MENQIKAIRAETENSNVNLLVLHKREKELLLCKNTDLELRETELMIANNKLTKEVEALKTQMTLSETSTETQKIIKKEEMFDEDSDSGTQIAFLNSIIADMHKKNETLGLRIQALEMNPLDIQ